MSDSDLVPNKLLPNIEGGLGAEPPNTLGPVVGLPNVKGDVDGGDAGQEAVANSQTADAIRACSPFLLPPDKYDLWREVNLQFYPFRS